MDYGLNDLNFGGSQILQTFAADFVKYSQHSLIQTDSLVPSVKKSLYFTV